MDIDYRLIGGTFSTWCLSTVNNVAVCNYICNNLVGVASFTRKWICYHTSYITNDNFVKIQTCTMHACLCYNNDMSNLLPLLQ